MTDAMERYLRLATILKDPNANISDGIMDDAFDEMESIWQSLTKHEQEEIERIAQEL